MNYSSPNPQVAVNSAPSRDHDVQSSDVARTESQNVKVCGYLSRLFGRIKIC